MEWATEELLWCSGRTCYMELLASNDLWLVRNVLSWWHPIYRRCIDCLSQVPFDVFLVASPVNWHNRQYMVGCNVISWIWNDWLRSILVYPQTSGVMCLSQFTVNLEGDAIKGAIFWHTEWCHFVVSANSCVQNYWLV